MQQRREAIFRDLPDALSRTVVCLALGAGQSLAPSPRARGQDTPGSARCRAPAGADPRAPRARAGRRARRPSSACRARRASRASRGSASCSPSRESPYLEFLRQQARESRAAGAYPRARCRPRLPRDARARSRRCWPSSCSSLAYGFLRFLAHDRVTTKGDRDAQHESGASSSPPLIDFAARSAATASSTGSCCAVGSLGRRPPRRSSPCSARRSMTAAQRIVEIVSEAGRKRCARSPAGSSADRGYAVIEAPARLRPGPVHRRARRSGPWPIAHARSVATAARAVTARARAAAAGGAQAGVTRANEVLSAAGVTGAGLQADSRPSRRP